jgi:hypothetical protein
VSTVYVLLFVIETVFSRLESLGEGTPVLETRVTMERI